MNIQEFFETVPTLICGGKQSQREVETIDNIYKFTLDKKAPPFFDISTTLPHRIARAGCRKKPSVPVLI